MFGLLLDFINSVLDNVMAGSILDITQNKVQNAPPVDNMDRKWENHTKAVSTRVGSSIGFTDIYSGKMELYIIEAYEYEGNSFTYGKVIKSGTSTFVDWIDYKLEKNTMEFKSVENPYEKIRETLYLDPLYMYNWVSDKYGISHYETIKVREIFKKKIRIYGYPVREYSAIDYYSGLALWLPNNMVISAYKTNEFWRNFPRAKWRFVIIEPFPLEGENIDYIADFLSYIPLGSFGTRAIQMLYSANAMHYPVFPNMAFEYTMNDIVLDANWDLIIPILNRWGY